jgi:hypothetical protein
LKGDIVKIIDDENQLYEIYGIKDSVSDRLNGEFGQCLLKNLKTNSSEWTNFPISELMFVGRDFEDPDHF